MRCCDIDGVAFYMCEWIMRQICLVSYESEHTIDSESLRPLHSSSEYFKALSTANSEVRQLKRSNSDLNVYPHSLS